MERYTWYVLDCWTTWEDTPTRYQTLHLCIDGEVVSAFECQDLADNLYVPV